MRETYQAKIGRMIENSKDLKQIANIRASGKKHQLTKMRNATGEHVEGKQGMLDVSSDFYDELYRTRRGSYSNSKWADGAFDKVPKLTSDEVEKELAKIAKKKSSDQAGIVGEMIQLGGKTLTDQLAALFTDIMEPGALVPDYCRKTRLSKCSSRKVTRTIQETTDP